MPRKLIKKITIFLLKLTKQKEKNEKRGEKTNKSKKKFKKDLTNGESYDIIFGRWQFGGIAQLARATGSYPVGHGFKSNSRYQARWSSGQDTALSRR